MSARRPAPVESHAVSALFDSPEAVDQAVTALIRAGVPRDLIEIVVSPEAAGRFYGGRVRGLGRETMRFAGIGGLAGLILGAAISLVIIALPGFQDPGLEAIVQLIGPNFVTVAGALVGAAIGLFVRRRAELRFARDSEAPYAIVVVVVARSLDEEQALARILVANGGRAPRRETD